MLRVVGVVFWSQFRTRWRSWLAVVILISVVGGVVLAAVAAGRRTESAFPGFVRAHGFDADVFSTAPIGQKISQLPGVRAVTEAVGPGYNGQPTCACTHPINPSYFGVVVVSPKERSIFSLVSGRLPNPSNPNEVLASYTLQQDEGLHLGSVVRVPFYSRAQESAYDNATGPLPEPTGPTAALRIVGFEATETEFPYGSNPAYFLYATPAFARTVLPRTIIGHVYFVQLRDGAADLPRIDAAAKHLGSILFVQPLDYQVASVEASIRPQAVGWWLLAALAALVGLAVIGQALGRQSLAESEDFPTLAALGLQRRQLVALSNSRNFATGLAGAVGAMVLATLLSPIAPLGEARSAESSTGITFDLLVLMLGGISIVIVVVTLGLWSAIRTARTARASDHIVKVTPSKLASRLWSAGAPMSLVLGVRNALERRTGGTSVPVGSALLGTVLAVMALCGSAVFGASLTHLTGTPKLYGDPFQLNVSNPNGGTPDPVLLHRVERDPDVARVTQGIALPAISINKTIVGAIAGTPIRGDLLFSTVDGHSPDAAGEVGLGATTMRQTGAHIGSVVRVTVLSPSGARRTVPFRVVAQMSLPVLGNAVSLGTGALFTLAGYEDAACGRGPMGATCRQEVAGSTNGGMLVSFVPGSKGTAALNRYLDHYQTVAAPSITPTSLINFGEAVNFPLLFGAVLAIFGAATLLHLLMVSVHRRRREVGLLKIVGFVNRQVGSTVGWQATTVALVGVIVGAPLGVVVGRATWHSFAANLGAVPVSVVPVPLIFLLSAAVLVGAVLLSLVPALTAIRARPRDLLQTS